MRWSFNDSKLISVGGNDTSMIVWNNEAFDSGNAENSTKKSISSLNEKSLNDLVLRNSRKGESDESDTDDEDEGYDSDVKKEFKIDYLKSIFDIQLKRPTDDVVKKMYDRVTTSDKK